MATNPPDKPVRSASDKEKSRQQSRPISGKSKPAAGGKAGQAPAGGKAGQAPAGGKAGQAPAGGKGTRPGGQRAPRPTKAPAPAAVPRRNPAALFTWGIVGLVIVIVVVLVVIKVSSGGTGNTSGTKAFQPVQASVAAEVTSVPASVFNKVGVTSSTYQVSPPKKVSNQPSLKFSSGASKLPGFFYYGAEYCPYCAAERWAMILSLSRFGTLKNLGLMESSSTDVYPSTPTFTFAKATYSSQYIAAQLDEYLSNQVGSNGQYEVNQQPTPQQAKLVNKYDSSTYFGGASDNYPAFPFIDMGNKVLQLSSSYLPTALHGFTQATAAQVLTDPTNPVTQAIVATSNYLTAGICSSDGEKPASVCASKGVRAADKALSLAS